MSRVTISRSFQLCNPRLVLQRTHFRPFGTDVKTLQSDTNSSTTDNEVPPTSSRWFSHLQARVKQLRSEKYPPQVVEKAEKLLLYTETNWMGLLAGREGFLTEPKWRGLDNHQVFWGDMDSMVSVSPREIVFGRTLTILLGSLLVGHINNVMYNRYAETGRVNFIRNHGHDATAAEQKQWEDLPTPRSLGLILKTITTEFKFPMKFPDRIHVLYKLTKPPTYDSTSLSMEAWILSEQHHRVAARCIEETAIYDYTSGKISQLKPFMVDKLQRTFDLQESSRKRYEEEARKVITAVEELESSSR